MTDSEHNHSLHFYAFMRGLAKMTQNFFLTEVYFLTVGRRVGWRVIVSDSSPESYLVEHVS